MTRIVSLFHSPFVRKRREGQTTFGLSAENWNGNLLSVDGVKRLVTQKEKKKKERERERKRGEEQ